MSPTQPDAWINLGPQSRSWLAEIGITEAEQLRQHDAYGLYARLKVRNPRVSVNLLYALLGAQEGVHWQQVQRERRSEILMRLDDLGLLPGRRPPSRRSAPE